MNKNYNTTGTVLEIVRMSTEDGPGIRTTVFTKGCSLKCSWCHNPESISMKPQVQWIGSRCIGCDHCLSLCPDDALSRSIKGIEINRKRCSGCGTCAETCPATAMELLGTKWESGALIQELLKDRAYFEKSGGGVTLSGGEAALQMNFSLELLKGLKAAGIHTALDTCGQVRWESLEALLPYCDLLLYDLKEIDPGLHKNFTGVSNELILENLLRAADFMKNHILPSALWIRTPLVPDATAKDENIRDIAKFLKDNIEGSFERWELCAFNNLCRDKYLRLSLSWEFHETELMTKDDLEHLAGVARESGLKKEKVIWTGSARLEEDTLREVKTGDKPIHSPGTC